MGSRLRHSLRFPAVVLLFVLVGVIGTYPLVHHFSTGIPYTRLPAAGNQVLWMKPADSLQLYYWFWLLRDNLVGNSPLLSNPYEFAVTPVLPPQHYGFYQVPLSLLFLVFAPFGGAFAYNALVILSFVLAGLAMYLLVFLYTERRGSATVAGLIFALAPFRLDELLGGHSNGFLFFFFPLAFYCYEAGLRRRAALFGLGAGLCIVGVAVSDFHLLYYLLLCSAAFWTVRGIEALGLPWGRGLRVLPDAVVDSPRLATMFVAVSAVVVGVAGLTAARRGVGVPGALLGATAAVVLVGTIWLISALIHLAGRDMEPRHALRRGARTLTPIFALSLYGVQWIADIPHWGGFLFAVALSGIVLLQGPALVAIVRSRPESVTRVGRVLVPVAAAVVLAAAYVLLLRAAVMDESFTVTSGRPYWLIARNAPPLPDLLNPMKNIYLGLLPAVLGIVGWIEGWRSSATRVTVSIYGAGCLLGLILSLGPSFDPWLPLYRLLYTYLPFFNYPRNPDRLMIVTFTGLAVLAGLAVRRLTPGTVGTRVVLFALAVGIAFEYSPRRAIGITLLDFDNPLYRIVGRELKDRRFLAIPLFPGDSHQSSVYQFYVTTTQAPMVNGYNPLVSRQYVSGVFDRLINLNLGELRPAEYELLSALQVKFLLIHEELFFGKVSPFPGWLAAQNLRASPYLTERGRSGDLTLFELRNVPAGPTQRFDRSSPVGSLHEIEELPRRIGREVTDPDASNRRAVTAQESRDPPGHLSLGQVGLYPSGVYLAAFRLKFEGARRPAPVALIDVSTRGGRDILARREIAGAEFSQRGEYTEFDLSWSLEAPARVEFRVYYLGTGELWADRVYVSFWERRSPDPAYEAEELLRHRGEVRIDSQASGGLAVFVAPGTPEDYPIFGPNRRYPPGRYEARFLLKLDGGLDGPDGADEVAVVDVYADRGRRRLAVRSVTGQSLGVPGRYREVRLPFAVDRPAVLEFRLLHRGHTGLWIDRVKVQALAQPVVGRP